MVGWAELRDGVEPYRRECVLEANFPSSGTLFFCLPNFMQSNFALQLIERSGDQIDEGWPLLENPKSGYRQSKLAAITCTFFNELSRA